ncbi:transmembrane protein 126 [Ptiloglossa arizonensis]|uniref:transmembrane protein 126 n=1 Tax=Ptiloglossa arizonensis TaxID=3350558 RepID=UPI003FA08779
MALIPVTDVNALTMDDLSLSRLQIIQHQKDLIHDWDPASEVWPLKYGGGCFTVIIGMSNIIINQMFRRKLKLHNIGRTWTSLGVTVGSTSLGFLFFEERVTKPIILYQHKCPMCLELKAITIITLTGLLYPLVLSPVMNLTVAAHIGLRIPHYHEVAKLSKFWWSVVQPSALTLATVSVFNTIGASLITYKQILSAQTIASVLLRITKHQEENADFKLFN